jgi:5-methylcytosine-specific restriction endonuclease McrA
MAFCEVHFRPYPAEHSGCVLCYQSKAKNSRTSERETQKQESIKAKQKDTAKGSKTAIKQVSKKQAAINAEKSRIKQRMQAACNVCFTCESAKGETLSHIITAKNKAFELLPLNLVLLCMDCHYLYEHDKRNFAILYPLSWQLKLDRAKRISTEHYQKLKAKGEQD